MGQKVNPIIFRIGPIYHWTSKWFSKKNYKEFLKQDVSIRKFIQQTLRDGAIEKVEIERSRGSMVITIYTAKPGFVIGRGGEGVESLKKKIQERFLQKDVSLTINIQEVKNPNMSAAILLQEIISDLEKRIPFRRVMKQAMSRAQKAQVKGIKIICSGRLNGVEIARSETFTWGNLPLHTIRADIDYKRGAAHTTYGTIGVKVWIYKGEKFHRSSA